MNSLFAGQGLGFWYRAARPASFGQSVMPYILGALIGLSSLIHAGPRSGLPLSFLAGGSTSPSFGILSPFIDSNISILAVSILAGILGLIGVILAHAGMNLLDDYFDMKKGAVARREELLDGGFRARLGKCAYLKSGNLTLDDLKRAALSFLICALGFGALLFALRGWEVLVFALITLILGISYAGPPLRLSYRGFGELVIAFLFGPVLITAASFLVSGHISSLVLFSSIPIGLLVANIVHTHAVMDYGPDLAAQRKTLPILLGSERAGILASVCFVLAAQASILIGIALNILPLAALLIAISYPLTVSFIKLALRYVDRDGQKETDFNFEPKFWMGNFGDWEKSKAGGLAWFMSRWLSARNLVMQVTFVLAFAAFTPWTLQSILSLLGS